MEDFENELLSCSQESKACTIWPRISHAIPASHSGLSDVRPPECLGCALLALPRLTLPDRLWLCANRRWCRVAPFRGCRPQSKNILPRNRHPLLRRPPAKALIAGILRHVFLFKGRQSGKHVPLKLEFFVCSSMFKDAKAIAAKRMAQTLEIVQSALQLRKSTWTLGQRPSPKPLFTYGLSFEGICFAFSYQRETTLWRVPSRKK